MKPMTEKSRCLYCGASVPHGVQVCLDCMTKAERLARQYRALPHRGLCSVVAYGAMLAGVLLASSSSVPSWLIGGLMVALGLAVLYLSESIRQ